MESRRRAGGACGEQEEFVESLLSPGGVSAEQEEGRRREGGRRCLSALRTESPLRRLLLERAGCERGGRPKHQTRRGMARASVPP